MRRSVEEGVNSRFVTGDRVHAVLKVRKDFFAVWYFCLIIYCRKCRICLHSVLPSIWTAPFRFLSSPSYSCEERPQAAADALRVVAP